MQNKIINLALSKHKTYLFLIPIFLRLCGLNNQINDACSLNFDGFKILVIEYRCLHYLKIAVNTVHYTL